MWLIVVGLVTVVVAAGFAVERGFQKTSTAQTLTVPRTVYTDSTANIREGGAVFPTTFDLGGQISGGPSHLSHAQDAAAAGVSTAGVGGAFCHEQHPPVGCFS